MSLPTLADLAIGRLERLVFVPLFALKRARGWKRRGLALLYLTIALASGALGWREVEHPAAPGRTRAVRPGEVRPGRGGRRGQRDRGLSGRRGEVRRPRRRRATKSPARRPGP